MRCHDCRKTGIKRVFIPIPVNTWKPTVCEDCAQKREAKWGHTYKKGTGKWSKTGYGVLTKGHMVGVKEDANN